MAVIESWFAQERTQPVKVRYLDGNIFSMDNNGNLIGIEVLENGGPASISGSVSASVIRADGATVAVTGSRSGNKCSVVLPQACYAIPGAISIVIKLTSGSDIATIGAVVGIVYQSSTDTAVDPGTIIPSISSLIAAIDAAIGSIPADYSALLASIASDYSSSKKYSVGAYCWEAGVLKRCIVPITSAETYTAAHWTNAVIGDDLSALNFTLYANYSIYKPEPLPESLFVYANKVLNSDGTALSTMNGYYTTDFIPIYSDALCIGGSFIPQNNYYNTLVLYDENFNPIYKAYGTDPVYVCRHFNAKYFRASHDANGSYYVNIWDDNDIKKYYTSAEPRMLDSKYYIHGNCVLNAQGEPQAGFNTWAITDLIRLDNRDVIFTGTFFPNDLYITFALYDENREMIMHAKNNDIVRLSDYPEAVYFRAAHSIESDEYYVNITNKEQEENENGITVHVGADQEYTTLRSGVAAAIAYPNSTVVVHPGVYDLASEFAAEIQAATGSAGITLANNVHVLFLAGSYVKAIFDTSSEWISTHFEPFRGMNFILDGLNIEASNCRYCVHDEQGGADVKYHNVYLNCVMKMTSDSSSGATFISPQCIGGGLGKYGYIEIVGGHYSSYCNDASIEKPPISYHNGYSAGCDGKIFIRDVYLANDGFFRFGYYGASTIITRVMVSGCSMGASIMKRPENSTAQIDNFEIIEWNNIIRS